MASDSGKLSEFWERGPGVKIRDVVRQFLKTSEFDYGRPLLDFLRATELTEVSQILHVLRRFRGLVSDVFDELEAGQPVEVQVASVKDRVRRRRGQVCSVSVVACRQVQAGRTVRMLFCYPPPDLPLPEVGDYLELRKHADGQVSTWRYW